ncbi:MAG: hypothetical protein ISS84_01580 [Candidatus Pacebacteria bacterium]|nr:hypothetical protein [Candidatus Paceibacterota bacterium]
MSKTSETSMKNTKAELFTAYQEMREKFLASKKEQLPIKPEAAKKEEQRVMEKTAAYSPETLENEINNLGKKIQASLEDKKNQLVQESQKLNELRQAVRIETKGLQETYNITLAADTLQALIAEYDAKEKELQEQIGGQKKSWEREHEEHAYNLKIARRKENDEYEAEQSKKRAAWQEEMTAKEKELEEREQALTNQTEEIENMKKQTEDFPARLERKINEAKQGKEIALRKDFATEKQMLEQKFSAEKGILEVKNNNLEALIKNQSSEMTSLKQSLTEANQRAQNLATSVIEGAKRQEQEKKEREGQKVEQEN